MVRVARYTLAAASITLTLAGCQDATAPDDAPSALSARPMMSQVQNQSAPLVKHTVAPQATDPAINTGLADHYVWLDPTARGNPKLLVFLPGNNNQPAGWQLLEQEAARLGYHVIGLMYQNDVTVVQVCKNSPEADRWVSIGVTPAAKYFALFHDRDHLVAGIRLNLAALDLLRFGDPVQAEGNPLPYGGTHILFTDLKPTLGYDALNAPHQSTARDNNTPLGPDDTPLLHDAWRYLLGAHEAEEEVAG